MENIDDFKVETSDLEEFEKKSFITIKKDSEFYGILLNNGFDDNAIKKYIGQCIEFFEDFKSWKNIKTLEDVENSGTKYIYKLYFSNNDIYRVEEMVEPYKKYYLYRSKFIYKDFPNSFNDIGISNIDNTNLKIQLKNCVKDGSWIYLTGALRSGRTYAAIALANGSVKKGFSNIAFIDSSFRFADLLDLYFHNKERFNNVIFKLKNAHLLVIDGFGNEYINEPLRDNIVIPLLLERANNKKMTIFTSDFSIDQIVQMYSKKDSVKGAQLSNILKSMIKKEIATSKNSLY